MHPLLSEKELFIRRVRGAPFGGILYGWSFFNDGFDGVWGYLLTEDNVYMSSEERAIEFAKMHTHNVIASTGKMNCIDVIDDVEKYYIAETRGATFICFAADELGKSTSAELTTLISALQGKNNEC